MAKRTHLDSGLVGDAAGLDGLTEHEHREYWERFYASAASREVPEEPSAFATWVAEREPTPGPLVDIGTGTGRDALWFCTQRFDTVGLDYAESAVARATEVARSRGQAVTFETLNLYHRDEVDAVADQLARDLHPRVLYARFLVHALEDDGRLHLWRFARAMLPTGGRLYLEFRVAETEHVFGEHYRRFVEPERVAAEIGLEGGRIEHHEVGYGLAVYKTEDPRVARIVASWR